MQFVEMGNPGGKTLMLLPGTACDYQTNFGSVLDQLGEKYHLVCVNYDGFDGSGAIFPDMPPSRRRSKDIFWSTLTAGSTRRWALLWAGASSGS